MDFVAFLVLAVVVVTIVLKIRKHFRGRLEEEWSGVRALAAQGGWTLEEEPTRSLRYRITGETDGVRWQVKADSDVGADSKSSTTWTSDAVQHADLLAIIRTRSGYDALRSAWGRAATGVLEAMTRAAGWPDMQHDDLLREGERLVSGNADIDDRFVAVVKRGGGAADLLTPQVCDALRAWAAAEPSFEDSLSVDVGQTNLRVYCRGIPAAAELHALILVGVAVARAVRPG